MSRMTAESEASQRLTRSQWTAPLPISEQNHDDQHHVQNRLYGSWSTSESFAAPQDLQGFLNDLVAPEACRMGLMDCCEEISEQLLQIRDDLKHEDCSPDVVRLKVFGD